MAEQRQRGMEKNQNVPKAPEKKSWRDIIAHVLRGHVA